LPGLKRVAQSLDAYLEAPDRKWEGLSHDNPIAYFCAEYGIHESFAQYCGGLGILAGDHCKEASDQHLPFIGIGCFYRLGYFRQSIDFEGRQEHVYTEFDYRDHALERVANPSDGKALLVELNFRVESSLWQCGGWRSAEFHSCSWTQNVPENTPEDRAITAQLYMLGRETRFLQELVLGSRRRKGTQHPRSCFPASTI